VKDESGRSPVKSPCSARPTEPSLIP
jgi:hypothetical protein